MNISIFDVTGPIMVGPSSSHTAGAAKLARTAALIAQKPFTKVKFHLHGSFLKTGLGHGTHQALLAGALGLKADDEKLPEAYLLAEAANISYEFDEIDLPDNHENSAQIVFYHTDNTISTFVGSSIGGGRIVITKIDDTPVEITAEMPTILVSQLDKPGVISEISQILAQNNINIAIMRVSRVAKGDTASTVIETDSHIEPHIAEKLNSIANVLSVKIIDINGEF